MSEDNYRDLMRWVGPDGVTHATAPSEPDDAADQELNRTAELPAQDPAPDTGDDTQDNEPDQATDQAVEVTETSPMPGGHLHAVDTTGDESDDTDTDEAEADADPSDDPSAGPQSWDELMGLLGPSTDEPAEAEADTQAETEPATDTDTTGPKETSTETKPAAAPAATPAVADKATQPSSASKVGAGLKGGLGALAVAAITVGVLGVVGVVLAFAIVGGGEDDTDTGQDDLAPAADTESDTTGTGGGDEAEAPAELAPEKATVVAGQCTPDGEQQRIVAATDSLRGAVAGFQAAYFAKDTDGVKDTISRGNAELRDQDWSKVFDQISDDANYCVTMPPAEGDTVTATVEMTAPDKPPQTFKQRVRGTEGDDGAWRVLSMTPID